MKSMQDGLVIYGRFSDDWLSVKTKVHFHKGTVVINLGSVHAHCQVRLKEDENFSHHG
jgi:hypothetical protein